MVVSGGKIEAPAARKWPGAIIGNVCVCERERKSRERGRMFAN